MTREQLERMLECFTDSEEFHQFAEDFHNTLKDILNSGSYALENSDDDRLVRTMALNQFFQMTMFFKDNVELFHQFMSVLEYREVSQEEHDRLARGDVINGE